MTIAGFNPLFPGSSMGNSMGGMMGSGDGSGCTGPFCGKDITHFRQVSQTFNEKLKY